MKILRKSIIAASGVAVAFTLGCSKKKDEKETTQVSINALAVSSQVTFATGSSTPESLESLKYMISGIQICESLTADGSRFSNTINCASVYTKELPGALADSTNEVPMATIEAMQNGEYSDHQIDLMDAASRARLNQAAEVKAGTYNYAVITWASPIQFRASVDVNGTTIYSKATTSVGSGDNRTQSTTTHDVRVAPAKDAVLQSPNGGTFFKFPKPFVITDADVEADTKFVIDLVFNPDGVIRATDDPNALSMTSWFKGDTGGMYVPMLSLAPVPRKADDTNSKEVYTLTTADNSYRLELYYNTSDADKSILGASLVEMSSLMSDDAKIVSITETSGKLNFTSTATEGPGSGPDGLIKNFVRGASCAAEKVSDAAVTACTLDATIEAK